jgi:serine/threonine-protein phosphatase 2A activator
MPGSIPPSDTKPIGQLSPPQQQQIPKLIPRRRPPPTSQSHENEIPVPATPPLPSPPDLSSAQFTRPRRRILSKKDHELFLKSETYTLILAWIFGLADAVEDQSISSVSVSSPLIQTLLSILDTCEGFVRDNQPTQESGSRFGNKTFIRFVDAVKSQSVGFHKQLGIQDPKAIEEISTYLLGSFGNTSRIDYGSGHELNFGMWLLCLYQLSILPRSDFRPLVLLVFTRYLELMRLVQTTYYLEPAGSHGVWGLDDYHFLPFLFGASQLVHHPYVRPKSIHSPLILEELAPQNLYFNQVAFVNSVKTVEGLRWHSPMLDDISAAKSWGKIRDGMKRMFVREVLGKVPVMQHFQFGSLIPAAEGMTLPQGAEDDDEGVQDLDKTTGHDGHEHSVNTWGDCCGIKVPSAIAAYQEDQKGEERLRRLPFD